MFPKLNDLLFYFFGIRTDLPVQTYGLFLALAFLAGGMVLRSELRRKELEGLLPSRIRVREPEAGWVLIIGGALISALAGWKFFGIFSHYQLLIDNPRAYLFSLQGNVLAGILILSVSLGYGFYRKKFPRPVEPEEEVHPYQLTWNILMIALISALIGSKLFDILDNFSSFLDHPLQSIFSLSGLTFYGGFLVTVAVLLIYVKRIHLDWKHVIDSAAPGILLGYAIGRMGCHLSGDGCWGIENLTAQPHWLSWLPDWTWAYDFPHNSVNRGILIEACSGTNCRVLATPVFPTSLYESVIALALFSLLWGIRKKIKAPVVMFGIFLLMNGTERFLIEKIRINPRYDVFGLSLSQAGIIALLLILSGILVIYYFSLAQKKAQHHPEVLNKE
jgi:phosphatidylglycerol---prolipoprotein diacylglyceryl transferase